MLEVLELIEDFLFHCRYEKNLSGKTIVAYETDLCQFHDFLLENHQSTNNINIKKTMIKQYIKILGLKYKSRTIKRKLVTLKAFFPIWNLKKFYQ